MNQIHVGVSAMDTAALGRLDLNLLVTLQVLLEERNVSKAAERMFITQSAMSKALGRLRETFSDPLFTRGASGMVPTPRAEALADQLPVLLQLVESVVSGDSFDPMTYEGSFTLVLPEFVGFWALPGLVEQLAKRAPGIRLQTTSRIEHQMDMLREGEIDFAIHVEHTNSPSDIRAVTVGFAPPTLLARKDHPLVGKELTWEMIEAYPQASVYIPDISESQLAASPDSEFIRHESAIEAKFQTGHLFTAIQVIKTTDYLLPGPPIFIEQSDLSKDIVALPLPGGEELMIRYVLSYHQRIETSKPHQFLRDIIMETIEHYRKERGLPSLAVMREQRHLSY